MDSKTTLILGSLALLLAAGITFYFAKQGASVKIRAPFYKAEIN